MHIGYVADVFTFDDLASDQPDARPFAQQFRNSFRTDRSPDLMVNFLEWILGEPAARSRQRAIERRIRDAKFHEDKNLADFDWTFNPKIPKAKIAELVTARFVETHANLLLIGPPDVGKSHVAAAIAVGAIRAGRRALLHLGERDLGEALGARGIAGGDEHARQADQRVADTPGNRQGVEPIDRAVE